MRGTLHQRSRGGLAVAFDDLAGGFVGGVGYLSLLEQEADVVHGSSDAV
jgi:hypothetical protein